MGEAECPRTRGVKTGGVLKLQDFTTELSRRKRHYKVRYLYCGKVPTYLGTPKLPTWYARSEEFAC